MHPNRIFFTKMNNDTLINRLLELAIEEDIGKGDHTSIACIENTKEGKAHLIAKEQGIFAGKEIAQKLYTRFPAEFNLVFYKNDGDRLLPGEVIFEVSGNVIAILATERLALNFLQRMSGIATATNKLVKLIEDYPAKILDTRKTAPGLRLIEKMAVRIGGAVNHRMGLHDMIMIKDNHIQFAGGIKQAIDRVFDYLAVNNIDLKVEIEAATLDDVKEILNDGRPHRIMLDNFDPGVLERAVERIFHRMETEASGGITEKNIREYAATGVDYISVGALTHHIRSLDMSIKAV